jgi:hypothetical protein
MKKTKIFSIFAALFVIAGTLFLYSCSKSSTNNEITPTKTNTSRTNKNGANGNRSFDFYGQLHNDFLTEVKTKFQIPSDTPNDDESRLNAATTFATNYINSRSDLSTTEKQEINNGLVASKLFWKKQNLFTHSFARTSGKHRNGLFASINQLYVNFLIDDWEKSTLEDLSLICERIYKQQAQANELSDFIGRKRLEHDTRGYSVESKFGKVSAMALSIAKNSNDWWEANPDASSNPTGV